MAKLSNEKGSMLLEYILVLWLAAVPFFVFWLSLFEPGRGYTAKGQRLMEIFQRILTGITLPIP